MPFPQYLFACTVAFFDHRIFCEGDSVLGSVQTHTSGLVTPCGRENALLPREMLALWNPTKVGAKQFHRASNFARKIISRGEPSD